MQTQLCDAKCSAQLRTTSGHTGPLVSYSATATGPRRTDVIILGTLRTAKRHQQKVKKKKKVFHLRENRHLTWDFRQFIETDIGSATSKNHPMFSRWLS
jgi:hypothetical protein